MQNWQEEMLGAVDAGLSEAAVFAQIEEAAHRLGFDFCAYGLRVPVPLANPQVVLLNNFPKAWQALYAAKNYVKIDPTVAHCRQSHTPIVWSDELFADTQAFWDEAQSFGLRFGWAQSSLDANGVGGMFTLSRRDGEILKAELDAKGTKMRWLANMAHMSLSRRMVPRFAAQPKSSLTAREIEVMQWTADGKTSSEIAAILILSESTINFHVKNAIAKLETPNKTAAVVRAAMLGLLS